MSNEELPPSPIFSESEINEEDKKIILQVVAAAVEKRDQKRFNLMSEISSAFLVQVVHRPEFKNMKPEERIAKYNFLNEQIKEEVKKTYPALYSDYLANKEAMKERLRGIRLNGEEAYRPRIKKKKGRKKQKKEFVATPEMIYEAAEREQTEKDLFGNNNNNNSNEK